MMLGYAGYVLGIRFAARDKVFISWCKTIAAPASDHVMRIKLILDGSKRDNTFLLDIDILLRTDIIKDSYRFQPK